jgi:hypothetical protein
MSEFVDTMFWVSEFILFWVVPTVSLILMVVGIWKVADAVGDTLGRFVSSGRRKKRRS